MMCSDFAEGNDALLRGKNYPQRIIKIVSDSFVDDLNEFEKFCKSVRGVEKMDIDNLLKDVDFEKTYLSKIDNIIK